MSKSSSPRQTLRLYWQHVRRRKPALVVIVVTTVVAVIAGQFLSPYVVSLTLDRLAKLPAILGSVLSVFGWLLLAYAIFDFIELFTWRLMVWVLWRFEAGVKQELYERSFDYLLNQSARFHSDHFSGGLVSQVNKFVSGFERIFDEFSFSILTIITAYLATIILLFKRAPLFVAVFVVVSIIYMLVQAWRMKRQFPYNVAEASAESSQTAQLADALTNISTIKPFANELQEKNLFHLKTSRVMERTLKTRKMVTINDTISNVFSNVLSFLSLLLSIIAVVAFHAPIGTLYLVSTYSLNLIRRLWELSRVMRNLNRGFGDAYDMTEILAEDIEVKDKARTLKLTSNRGDIRFKNVTYSYPNTHQPLFKELSLHIKPGEKVGLVGRSGSGKTSITKLILRLMDIQDGEITIDKQNISKLSQVDLRQMVTYVPQEPSLFHRSLADNIRYGRLDASDQEIEAVAKMAHAHDFIIQLPKAYDTLVGERGTKLSGGQRQRVAIARAMLKNAPIVLLDEATSALDSESESLIQDALWRLMAGRTVLIIAHRLSTIQKMDRIIVMDEGRIIEQGSHKELIRQNGTYAELWSRQSGGFLNS